jgi:GNAT superfamily N-acetyltransferase
MSKVTHFAVALYCGAMLTAQPLRAEFQCEPVDKIKYSSDKMPSGWEKVEKTTADDDIEKLCVTKDWSKPLNDWYYGDYDFLFSDWKDRYPTEKAREEPMKSRSPKYIREIKRYSCTENGAAAGFFAFHLDAGTTHPGGELTFLCVPKNLRSAGIGVRLFNAAVSEAGSKGGGDTVNLRIKALVSAIPFYNSFDMNCSDEKRDHVKVTTFDTGPVKLTKGKARLSRRAYSFNENLESGGKPSCKRIKYECDSKESYKGFFDLGAAMLQAGYNNPLTQTSCDGSIDVATATKLMCDLLKQGNFDLDEEIKPAMDAKCKK